VGWFRQTNVSDTLIVRLRITPRSTALQPKKVARQTGFATATIVDVVVSFWG